MTVFLTASELADTSQPIVCEVNEGVGDWSDWEQLRVDITPPVAVVRGGKRVQLTELILVREKGEHQPGEFWEHHAWVDLRAPAGLLGGSEFTDVRLGYHGLLHRTAEAAKEYVPTRVGWRKEQ